MEALLNRDVKTNKTTNENTVSHIDKDGGDCTKKKKTENTGATTVDETRFCHATEALNIC